MQKRCDSKGTNGNELVQCAGDHAHDGLHHQWSDDTRKLSTTELWWNGSGARCFVNVCPTDTIAVRRASAEATIASQKKAAESPKYYGAQPAELPKTLPVGTRTCYGGLVARHPLTLCGSGDRLGYQVAGEAAVFAWVYQIAWDTVLAQEAKPLAADITLITNQAQADALFGAGHWCAGLAGAALEENETDEAWCVRQLAEYTGKPAHCDHRALHVVRVKLDGTDPSGLMFSAPWERVKARDAEWFRAELALCPSWPRAGESAKQKVFRAEDFKIFIGGVECKQMSIPVSIDGIQIGNRKLRAKPDPYRQHALLHNIDERVVGELTRAKPGQEAAAIRNFVAWSNERRKPKATASSRELAEGHPVGWPSLEGVDEP